MALVDILLPTRNGAGFLAEQLDSLLAQSVRDWRIIARDDASDDDTPDLLRRFRRHHPERVVLLEEPPPSVRLGLTGNMQALLDASAAHYLMPCDQDDVWEPDKIELSLKAMQELERREGQAAPLAVFSDLVLCDAGLRPLAPSYLAAVGRDPRRTGVAQLLMENVASGCTMLFNRALWRRARPLPREALCHDWWLALVASGFGRLACLERPLVRYRQHDANALGPGQAQPLPRRRGPVGKLRTLARPNPSTNLDCGLTLARELSARFHAEPCPAVETARAFVRMQAAPWPVRQALCLRHGFLFGQRRKNALLLLQPRGYCAGA